MKKQQRPSTAKKSNLDLPEGFTLQQSIEIIYEHQKNCQKKGDYMQAEIAKRKVKELKQEYDRVIKEDLGHQHQKEKQEIEKLHLDELNNFNSQWDSIQRQFQADIQKAQSEMMRRHRDQLKKCQEELQQSIPLKPKQSPELINLRKIQENLAKHQNYVEAHKVQLKAKDLENAEFQRYQLQRNQKIKNMLAQVRSKQESQLSALRQKILAGVQQKKKLRSIQLQKMLQKYQIRKKELQFQQGQEFGRFERSAKSQSVANFSKYNSKASVSSKR